MHPATAAARTLFQAERAAYRHAEEQTLAPLRPAAECRAEDIGARNRTNNAGRESLARLERAFAFLREKCGVRLGYLQRKFLNAALIILLQRIYGDDIAAHAPDLKRRFHIQRLYNSAAIVFPRRSGKTTVQTLLAACVAVAIADGNVCAVNLTGRQGKAWLSQCRRWMMLLQQSPEFQFTISREDSREFIEIVNCMGTTVRVSSFPGTSLFLSFLARVNHREQKERRRREGGERERERKREISFFLY